MNFTCRNSRRSVRIPGYDYARAGAYFITLASHRRACTFGDVIDGAVRLTKIGAIAEAEWLRTAEQRPNVLLDQFIVMPNHLHALLWLDDDGMGAPRERRFGAQQAGSLSAIVGGYKAAVTRRARDLVRDASLIVWQRNYFEHVVRRDESLDAIRRYIVNNPAAWAEDSDLARRAPR